MVEKCFECQRPILDPYLLNVAGSFYHEKCVQCSVCALPLSEGTRCYSRLGKFYCDHDYNQIVCVNLIVCSSCQTPIRPGQLYVGGVWPSVYHHTECFVCAICSVSLHSKGTKVLLFDNRPICAHHRASLQPDSGKKKKKKLGSS